MADLNPKDVEKAKLHFGIYDFEGVGKVDAVRLGDVIRSLDLKLTDAAIEKAGGTKKKGEKLLTLEEFLPIYSDLKKNKDVGAFEDMMEGLKVYDKSENGTIMEAELAHTLMSLGEKMNDADVEEVMKACAGAVDEEGFIKYETFVKNVMAGPFPAEETAEAK